MRAVNAPILLRAIGKDCEFRAKNAAEAEQRSELVDAAR